MGGCTSAKRTVAFKAVETQKTAVFDGWLLGDCEMRYLEVGVNSANEGNFIYGSGWFSAEVCTHSATSTDVWHFSVDLAFESEVGKAKSPTFVMTHSFDGPSMVVKDKWYTFYDSFPLPQFPGGAVHVINYAVATSCC